MPSFLPVPLKIGIFSRAAHGHDSYILLLNATASHACLNILLQDDDRKVQLFRRESRTPPEAGDHDGLIEYFMNTVTEDMQFEVSRWRPTLNDSFFR
jgi:hypothetical protein